ncbi:MAG: hypothetical protein EPO68_09755 [Planctomycetota bacterium]|nr:MAG: hypothetical protein EPO68_09755 [Planctomycetota bacterium]
MRASPRLLTCFGLLLTTLAGAACHDDDGQHASAGQPPTVGFVALPGATTGAAGISVAIAFSADDPDSVASCDVVAVQHSAIVGAALEETIASGLVEQNGAELAVVWNTGGVEPGAWRIEVRIDDGENFVVATAPTLVQLSQPSGGAVQLISEGDGGGLQPLAIHTTEADDVEAVYSTAVLDSFGGVVVYGAGQPNAAQFAPTPMVEDFVIARHAADGTLAWADRSFGAVSASAGLGVTRVYGVALSSTGAQPVVAGVYDGSVTFALGKPQQTTLPFVPHDGPRGFFLARWSDGGALVHARHGTGLANDKLDVEGFTHDGAPAALVVGSHASGGATLGAGEPHQTVVDSGFFAGGWVARFGGDGELDWALALPHAVPGADGQGAVTHVTRLSNGEFAVAGTFTGTVAFGLPAAIAKTASPGGVDAFVASITVGGALNWIETIGGAGADVQVHGLAGLDGGAVAIAIEHRNGAIEFAPGTPGAITLPAPDPFRAFALATFASDGALFWARDQILETDGADVETGPHMTAVGGSLLALAWGHEKEQPGELVVIGGGGPGSIPVAFSGEYALMVAVIGPSGIPLQALADGGGEGEPVVRGVSHGPSSGIDVLVRPYGPLTLGFGTGDPLEVPVDDTLVIARYGEF